MTHLIDKNPNVFSFVKSELLIKHSKKSKCADNVAMANFFGLLKQEMYYGKELVPYDVLKEKIEKYIHYYNNERIKQKLAGMSPIKYRTHTNQFAA